MSFLTAIPSSASTAFVVEQGTAQLGCRPHRRLNNRVTNEVPLDNLEKIELRHLARQLTYLLALAFKANCNQIASLFLYFDQACETACPRLDRHPCHDFHTDRIETSNP